MRSAGRERLLVVLLGAVGAGLVLLAASRSWVTVHLRDPLAGSATVHPSGRDVAAVAPAAALVALAAVVAAVTLRSVGRFVSGLILVLAGAVIGAVAVGAGLHPLRGAADAIRSATGRAGDVSASATGAATPWPWIALAAAVPIVLAGVFTVVRGRGWSGLSARYDAPDASADQPQRPLDEDPWDAVSRGEDPT
jgi:uncharacterized membrane protein (TIGR02234 family)